MASFWIFLAHWWLDLDTEWLPLDLAFLSFRSLVSWWMPLGHCLLPSIDLRYLFHLYALYSVTLLRLLGHPSFLCPTFGSLQHHLLFFTIVHGTCTLNRSTLHIVPDTFGPLQYSCVLLLLSLYDTCSRVSNLFPLITLGCSLALLCVTFL